MGLFSNIFGNKGKGAIMFRNSGVKSNSSAKSKKSKVSSHKSKKVSRRKTVKSKNLVSKKERKLKLQKIKKEKAEKHKKIIEEKKLKAEEVKKIKEDKLREKKEELRKHNELKEEKKKLIIEKKHMGNNEKVSKSGKLSNEYLRTYVPGFDKLLDPGIPKGSTVLVEGGPGSGKTLFCLTLLVEMCKRGKKVLYMSFEEPEERLREHITAFGADARDLEKKGILYIKRFNALDIARSVEALLSEAKKELLIDVQPVLIPNDFNAEIVLVDSLTSISSAFSGESSRFRIYMEQLFRYLEAHNITSFLIREVASPSHVGVGSRNEQEEAVSFLSDGIIALYNVFYKSGIRKRALEVLKMRGVNVDRKVVEYETTKKGVIVHPDKPVTGDYKLT